MHWSIRQATALYGRNATSFYQRKCDEFLETTSQLVCQPCDTRREWWRKMRTFRTKDASFHCDPLPHTWRKTGVDDRILNCQDSKHEGEEGWLDDSNITAQAIGQGWID